MTQVNSFRDIILLVYIGPRHIKKTIHPVALLIDIYICVQVCHLSSVLVVSQRFVNMKFLFMFTQC